jgi:hypothetical protein
MYKDINGICPKFNEYDKAKKNKFCHHHKLCGLRYHVKVAEFIKSKK